MDLMVPPSLRLAACLPGCLPVSYSPSPTRPRGHTPTRPRPTRPHSPNLPVSQSPRLPVSQTATRPRAPDPDGPEPQTQTARRQWASALSRSVPTPSQVSPVTNGQVGIGQRLFFQPFQPLGASLALQTADCSAESQSPERTFAHSPTPHHTLGSPSVSPARLRPDAVTPPDPCA